ncbi:T9SS type A sorting domain-containing protein [Chryseobacterium sp. GMJ5]|uniref:T9SS type A sorting domain-containing protein n=1 Tax=Chryseobacterium gilvum TaxID=2976534 RepID=A0ABT2W1G7_9FLAO|nr:T9SS type A sorting domain-containing protein [Chryseobacterium gilvum]MCU7615169.1 T9SS type A sorting domain-containing protein [Chryseobacterium gilvum]
MKANQFFMKPENVKISIWSRINKSRALAVLFGLVLMYFSTNTLRAQVSKVIPENNTSGTFLGPFVNSARTYQMIIDDSQLTTLAGKYLTSISFRLPGSATAAWPASDATFPSYEIFLSNGVDPVNRQLDFAANVVGTQTQVRSGSMLVPAGVLTAGSDPNAFTYDITFNTPYLYTGGNNLVIEIRHTGNNVSSVSTHSALTSASGYGSLFTACWKGTGSVTQANFSFVKINSVNNLGVRSVELDESVSVYPNPVKDNLYVKSAKDIAEFHVFNMVGQKIYSQKNNSEKPQLNVSNLAKGNYILQMIDKNGNTSIARFIKE